MFRVIIVIDLQNDFITGPLGTKEAIDIVPKIKDYIYKNVNQPYTEILFTQDSHDRDFNKYTIEGQCVPEHCIALSEGQKIADNLNHLDYKYYFDSVFKGNFGYLHWGREFYTPPDTIELVGLCTDICVISNALILRSTFPKAKIIVHSDMCAGTTPEKHKAALEVMKSCLIEVD